MTINVDTVADNDRGRNLGAARGFTPSLCVGRGLGRTTMGYISAHIGGVRFHDAGEYDRGMDSPADRSRTYGGKTMPIRRAERRRAFLEAGLEVFGDKGYTSSTITDLCKSAGLARNQFYAEFDSREALLIELYEQIQTDAHAAVTDALAVVGDPPDFDATVAAAMTALIESLGTDPRRARVCYIEMHGVSPRVEQYRAARRQLWVDFISDTIRNEAGDDFSPPGGHTTAAWGFLGALTELGSQWSLSEPRPPLRELVEVMTAILRALLPADLDTVEE